MTNLILRMIVRVLLFSTNYIKTHLSKYITRLSRTVLRVYQFNNSTEPDDVYVKPPQGLPGRPHKHDLC